MAYKRYRDAGDSAPPFRRRLFGGGYKKYYPVQVGRVPVLRMKKAMARGPDPIFSAEKKFVDQGIVIATGMQANTGWAAGELDPVTNNCLNAIAQGTGDSQRIGRKYAVHSIEVTGQVSVPAETNQTTGDTAISTFIALVWDKQTNGAQLNSEDVYKSVQAEVQSICSPLRVLTFSKRFKVLRTEQCVLKPPTLSWDGTNMEQGGDTHQFKWFVKFFKPIIVECTGTTAVVTSIMDNSFHVVGQASSSAALITYNSRVKYSDV